MPDSPDRSRLSTKFRRAPTRYVPLVRLAFGGMAEVWKGSAILETGEKYLVAIKRVLPQLAQDPTYRGMFEDEARLGMLLRHPNIVRVHDAREVGGTYIMIMELVDGTSLKAILERAHARSACMPPATALYIARQLASALSYAHGAHEPNGRPLGIIHCDVSPHNLLLGKDGAVKLADFGLADASVHSTHLDGGMLGGKLGYLAPELIEQQPSTPQIDVFAVGIVLWEMLSGRRLFLGDTDVDTVRAVARCDVPPPSRFNRRATPELDALVQAILERDPRKRTQGAELLVKDIDRVLTRIDPNVSPRDVSLVVGLHLATEPAAPQPSAAQSAAAFMEELDAFVTTGGAGDLGAAPLDPDAFGSRY